MFNSTPVDISRFWSILSILKPFACSLFLSCHPFGGRDSLKKRKIHEVSREVVGSLKKKLRKKESNISE